MLTANIQTDILSYPNRWLALIPIILLISCVALVLILLVHRTLMVARQKRKKDIRFRYQYLLYEALVESQSGKIADNFVTVASRLFQAETQNRPLDKQILADILINLRKSLSDQDQSQFLDLAYHLELPEYLLQKIRQRKLSIQIQGIREISALHLNDPETRQEIETLSTSHHPHLSQEIALALMKSDVSPDLSLLDDLVVPLSEWMQIRLHHYLRTVERYQLPNFGQWLDSNNESVVLFSLRMIADFEQQHAGHAVLLLLSSESSPIVLEAISTVVQLKLSEALPILINLVEQNNPDIQLASLQAVGELGSFQQVSNLHSFRSHPDYWIRRVTSEAISRMEMS